MSIASKWDEKLTRERAMVADWVKRGLAGPDLMRTFEIQAEDLRALVDDALEWHKLGVRTLVTQSLEAERLDKENSRLKARVEQLEKVIADMVALGAPVEWADKALKP